MSNMNDLDINKRKNNPISKDKDEINIFKRTIDNYTHEDINDKRIKKITSWRKSQKKFLSALFLNFITLGILHLISKCYPRLYLKLYCNICHPKNSDFFLVEDIYGQFKLCQTKTTKRNLSFVDIQNNSYDELSKLYMYLYSSLNLKLPLGNDTSHPPNDQYININNSKIISFEYNSKVYEYDEAQNIIIPIYLNLQGKTNKFIIHIFQEGLSSENIAKIIEDRYGRNEYKLNLNLPYLYFQKVEKKLLIYSIICGTFEVVIRDGVSASFLLTIVIIYFVIRKIFLYKLLNKYNSKDFTLDGEKENKIRARRNYLLKLKNENINKKIYERNFDYKAGIKFKNNANTNFTYKNNNDNFNMKNINYIIEKSIDNYEYVEIHNNEILPGDIIYLKKGEFVPCDGIILEGECIVNETELNEKLEYTYKSFLKYTNDIFDYKTNKNNLLFHGMKIINVYKRNNILSNNQKKYITFLCINTGQNTYKANQISNALDILERKKKYGDMYKLFSSKRLIYLISITIIFAVTILVPIIYIIVEVKKNGILFLSTKNNMNNASSNNPFSSSGPPNPKEGGPPPNDGTMEMGPMKPPSLPKEVKKEIIKGFIINFIMNFFLRAIIKSYMPLYFVVSSIIILIGIYRLYKLNIFCYEKMRILFAGQVNTVFMSRMNVLCDDKYEIKGFYPAFQASKFSGITLQVYYKDQLKEFSSVISSYYNNIKNNKESFIGLTNISALNKISGKCSVWFLECLFCCNNLIKIGKDIHGNLIEKNLFNDMKWEIKSIEEESEQNNIDDYIEETTNENIINDEQLDDENDIDTSSSNFNDKLFYLGNDKEQKFIYKKPMDIFPKNYYKMIDKKNFGYQKLISRFKFFLSKSILKRESKIKTEDLLDKKSKESVKKNPIMKDLSNTKCSSYKLRIYKKFITKNSLFSSAIVYNFLLKTLRFMTKGSPEKILPRCIINSLPGDICKTISDFRREGFVIIICASKKIDLYSYNESHNEEHYMKDLTFCGFITLKNNIKNESKKAIDEFKKMDCELIMNTGDNLLNSLGTGFEMGVLDNKKIYAIDFDDNQKQLYLNNIYRPSFFDYEIEEKIKEIRRKIKSSSNLIKKSKRRDFIKNKNKKRTNSNYNKSSQNSKGFENSKNDQSLQNLVSKNSNNKNSSRISPNKISNNSKNQNNDSFISSERARFINRTNTIKSIISLNKVFSNIKGDNVDNKNSNNNNNINQNIFPMSPIINRKIIRGTISLDKNTKNKIKDQHYIDKKSSQENQKNTFNNNFSNELENDEFVKEEFLKEYFSNICYYAEPLLKNLENDCIFCVSGKALKYIYENKTDIRYSNLLKLLSQKSKIYFSMTSQDKSFLIDFYREVTDKTTCMIGYSSSDIDSILTSHVGISLKKPNNLNMVLCHFYLTSKNIMDIKIIIQHGRAILENFSLLFLSCLFCTVIINLYMIISFCIMRDVKPEHLRILNVIYYSLSIFGFTNAVDNNIVNNLKQNNELFHKYIFIQFIGNIIIKSYDIIFFYYLYRKNSHIEEDKRNVIYISYCAILCFNQIFTSLFGFNFIRFYRKSFYDNFLFTLTIIIFFVIILIVTCLTRQGMKTMFSVYYTFENLLENSDTFDDRNKLIMFLIIIIDLISSFIFTIIVQYFFNKNSQKKINENIAK